MQKRNRRSGSVLLNAILIFTLALMIISYTTEHFQESLRNYQKLDEQYRTEIKLNLNDPATLKFSEPENA